MTRHVKRHITLIALATVAWMGVTITALKSSKHAPQPAVICQRGTGNAGLSSNSFSSVSTLDRPQMIAPTAPSTGELPSAHCSMRVATTSKPVYQSIASASFAMPDFEEHATTHSVGSTYGQDIAIASIQSNATMTLLQQEYNASVSSTASGPKFAKRPTGPTIGTTDPITPIGDAMLPLLILVLTFTGFRLYRVHYKKS